MEGSGLHDVSLGQFTGTQSTAVFCLYEQEDAQFYRELQKHLHPWVRQQTMVWLEIGAGDYTEQTTLRHLRRADLVLLLITPDFLAEDALYEAMLAALEEHRQRQVSVVPILARMSSWKECECGHLQALPDEDRPITHWLHRDEAYEQIRLGLLRLMPHFSQRVSERLSSSQTAASSSPMHASRPFQARELSADYVPRPEVFAALKRCLLGQRESQTTAITTALRGAGGFGKTTLALALCHDQQVQEAFPDGLFWLELGEQPPQTLTLLNRLLPVLGDREKEAITLEEAKARWHQALQDKRCLLVIDDVWQKADLRPLLEGGSHCMRLVTTRNDQVLPEKATRVVVDAMSPLEAMKMLTQGLPDEILHEDSHARLVRLVEHLGYWPLLLGVAHGVLATQLRYGRSLVQALEVVEQITQGKRGIRLQASGATTDFQETIDASLQISFQQLEELVGTHHQPVERYQELAIFPEDTDIPLPVLQWFWQETGGLKAWETEDLCMQLYDLSLLLTCDLGKGTIRLHDVMRNYLKNRASPRLSALHTRFLDASKQTLGISCWADLPSNEHYLWQYLVRHLCEAKQIEELQATLTDLLYLTRKVLYVGVSFLEADLLQASTFGQAETATPAPSLFVSFHRTVTQISHLLQRVSTHAEVGGLLLSYLGWEPAFAVQRPVSWHEFPRPFLTAWHPLPSRWSSALRRTLRGHTGFVTDCAVSADGSTIVSSSDDKTLKVWDASTGAERFTLAGHTEGVNGCAVSADGSTIVSSSYDKTLKVWDATTGTERLTLMDHTRGIWSCGVSADGRFVLSASDKTLKVWDASTGAERYALTGHTNGISGCAASTDGSTIVSSSYDETLKVWDASTGAERFTLAGHTEGVKGCAVSADGSTIVSSSYDRTLKVWDAVTGAERFTLTGHTAQVDGCAVSADGSTIVSSSDDRTLKVWDAVTGAERFTLTGHTGPITGCAVSADGSTIVSSSWDRTLRVWDAATGAKRLTLIGHISRITGCAVSADGSTIVSSSWDNTLKVWDAITGIERLTLIGHTSCVSGCAVSPDGKFIVSSSWDQTVKVWDAVTGAKRLTLAGHAGWVRGCAVSPNGKFIVSSSDDKTLRVWDAVTGIERLTLIGHTSYVSGCAVSPNGKFIVSSSWDKTLKVWDAVTGIEHLTLAGHTDWVNSCAVSANGSIILSASEDHTLKVWDIQTGRCMLTFPVDDALYGCALHPNGEHVVACGSGGVFFLRLVM